MGLAVFVGLIPTLKSEDRKALAVFQRHLAELNLVLVGAGLPPHLEPERLPSRRPPRRAAHSVPFEWLSLLRRAEAHRLASLPLTPSTADVTPHPDPLVMKQTTDRSHLLCHADGCGYYVPLDFPLVLSSPGRLPGWHLGSTVRLLAELAAVAPALGIASQFPSSKELRLLGSESRASHAYWRERQAWAHVYEGAAWSTALGSVLSFGIPTDDEYA